MDDLNITGTSLFQYWNERQDADGDPLFWPGGPGGFPYRGNPRSFTKDEYENMPLSYKARVKTFDLKDSEELEQYRTVREKTANGYYIIQDRKPIEDKTSGEIVKMYLEWLEPAYVAPPTGIPPIEEHVHAITGPNAASLNETATTNPKLFNRLAGIPPGMQFDQSSRRYF